MITTLNLDIKHMFAAIDGCWCFFIDVVVVMLSLSYFFSLSQWFGQVGIVGI